MEPWARLEAVPLQSGGPDRDSCNIFAIGGSDAEAQAQGVDDAENGGEFRVAVGAEGSIETLARDTGFAGHFGHTASASYDSEGVADKGRVSTFEGFGYVGGDGLAVVEVFGGIEGFGFWLGHSVSSMTAHCSSQATPLCSARFEQSLLTSRRPQ